MKKDEIVKSLEKEFYKCYPRERLATEMFAMFTQEGVPPYEFLNMRFKYFVKKIAKKATDYGK